jgi:putative two-component system hydrogenase maturation factor HypX/HoxX
MRILLLTHAFNGLSQRLYVELGALGHEVSVELDIDDRVTVEAAGLFCPHLILAPFLKRAIPESLWSRFVCLVVHPGIVGDRGPSALDWAILEGESHWGLTLIQAVAELDAGPVWAAETFPMRRAAKSSLYRREVTEAAVRAVRLAIERLPDFLAGRWRPAVPDRADPAVRGRSRPPMGQRDRAIDWQLDPTELVLAKIRCADGVPGVRDRLLGRPCRIYRGSAFPASGPPGALLGRHGEALVRATVDGAVRIGQVRPGAPGPAIKLPATLACPECAALPELGSPADPLLGPLPPEIAYRERGGVGVLEFDFYNGAMGTDACRRLLAAYESARARPTRVLVLAGGADFFSNGLDLNRIEWAESAADESMRNIEAMDDLCRAIVLTQDRLTVSALRGNAGAGGAFLALAADLVWARAGAILNPHYKNMGNLYGSEYWTYLLPRRVGAVRAAAIVERRLPLGAAQALDLGFVDALLDGPDLDVEIARRAKALADGPDLDARIAEKRRVRQADELARPLSAYRSAELAEMQRNFYGFDPSYHVARYRFVHKTPHAWTPRHLARHRDLGWVVPVAE